jgi:hypothetical protein
MMSSYQNSHAQLNGSIVIITKMKANENICTTAMLIYILHGKKLSQQKWHIFTSVAIHHIRTLH